MHPDEVSVLPASPAAHAANSYAPYRESAPAGIVDRFFTTLGQLAALLLGWLADYVRQQEARGRERRPLVLLLRLLLWCTGPLLDQQIVSRSFPVQFRLRLERLGPTYIKLGQILSLREDLLPTSITDELKNLLDRLPVVSFVRYRQLIEADLGRPLGTFCRWIDPDPLGSASLAQTHLAQLLTGENVVLKVLKPGVREMIRTDTTLLRLFGRLLQLFLARYQPIRLVDEFCRYTLREVDLRFEADNAEAFAANFENQPDVLFPRIYREFSNRNVLCMQYFNGIKPDAHAAATLTPAEKERVIDLGVGAIIQMIFRDGFFHADLHPANLIIFGDGSVGFIDLGMVGSFDRETQRLLSYYFYALVAGDPDNAARYLSAVALPGKNSDIDGFRRAVAGLYARWLRSRRSTEFSLGQMILQSVLLAGHYRIQYPGEIILMIKALITVEGVGNVLAPGLDIVAASRSKMQQVMLEQYNPLLVLKAGLLALPELVSILNRSPLVLTESLKQIESNLKRAPVNPMLGIQKTVFSGACILAAAILFAAQAPWPLWAALSVTAVLALLRP